MEVESQLKKVNLIYASETGTAYDFAKEFVLVNSHKMHINKFLSIEQLIQFDEKQKDCLWIFFIATTGQGDFPYSMRALWKKMLSKNFQQLTWMKFTIYAFGDRSYGDNFCLAARKLRQRLLGLGAKEAIQIGLGDQQEPNGYLQQFRDNWFPNLLKFLESNNLLINNTVQSQRKAQIIEGYTNTQNFDLKLCSREQVCDNKGRRTFQVQFQILNYPNPIGTGDILAIYPNNNPQDVNFLLKYFNLSPNQIPQSIPFNNSTLTYQQLFRSKLNISSVLNHSFFIDRSDMKKLSQYCQNQLFKEKLIQLQNDYDQYHNYIKKYKRNVVEVLKDFEINIPIEEFIKRCGMIVARKYSIAGVRQQQQSGKKYIKLLFRLVKSKINQNRMHSGLCSHDFALWMDIGDVRKGAILKGQFQVKQKHQNNLIFITLGTGIAPFMQFFEAALKSSNKWNMLLFYTNRYANQIYFQPYLQQLVAEDKLNPFLSFTGQGGKRIIRLVQDNCDQINKFIQKNCLQNIKIMICGPKEVCEGVQNILGKGLGVDMKILKKKKILVYENW